MATEAPTLAAWLAAAGQTEAQPGPSASEQAREVNQGLLGDVASQPDTGRESSTVQPGVPIAANTPTQALGKQTVCSIQNYSVALILSRFSELLFVLY